jgi:hypothetical protein
MSKKITPQMISELFENGIVIHRAWIMPPGCWEYSVQHAGETTYDPSIATRTSLSAAYNAAVRHLSAQHGAEPTCPNAGRIRPQSTSLIKVESPA